MAKALAHSYTQLTMHAAVKTYVCVHRRDIHEFEWLDCTSSCHLCDCQSQRHKLQVLSVYGKIVTYTECVFHSLIQVERVSVCKQ
jgi:hypothetical protein